MDNTAKYTIISATICALIIGFTAGYFIAGGLAPADEEKSIILVDDTGRSVTIKGPAEKIVSLASAATRTLYDLGALDKIIAVDKYSDDPAECENITKASAYDIEGIIALEPDVVISWWFYSSKLSQLEDYGIPVIYIHPVTIDGIYYDIKLIGKLIGNETAADLLIADLKTDVLYIESLVDNLTATSEKPNVYLELYSPYKTVGRDTFTHQMIEIAGGINIAENLTGYPLLGDEFIISSNPSIILYESDLPVSNFTDRPGWDVIDAVKTKNIYRLDRHIATANSRFVEGLVFMVEKFYNISITLPSET